jgi:predicted ester cyclase
MPDAQNGPAGLEQAVGIYRGAFSDLRLRIDDIVSDGDLVCIRWTSSGTNDGELMGMPATGKHATSTGISIDKIEDGKIVESWLEWDNAGLMQQLGVGAPAEAAAG